MDFAAHLEQTRLQLQRKVPAGHAAAVYNHAVAGVLEGLGLAPEFLDIYSAQRNSQCSTREGGVVMVIDHALVEHFHLLNGLLQGNAAPAAVKGAFNRMIAEECYGAGELRWAGVFLGRALASKAVLRHMLAQGAHGLETFWQLVTIIGHECGHAVPTNTELWEAMRTGARLAISAEVTAISGRINASLMTILKGGAPAIVEPAEDELVRDFDKGGGRTDSALLKVGNDDRFIAEVACDSFATSLVSDHIRRTTPPASVRVDVLQEALVATYKTFLNMRLHEYVSEVTRTALASVAQVDGDALLRGGYELSIRGRLARQSIVSIWDDLAPALGATGDHRDGFLQVLTQTGALHSQTLLLPARELLATTLLDVEFRAGVSHHLEEWGFDANEFEVDPWSARSSVESMWVLVAA